MNRAINAAATKQGGIRGVDDRVNRQFGDIALVSGEFGHAMEGRACLVPLNHFERK
jgi:hypothetical protein